MQGKRAGRVWRRVSPSFLGSAVLVLTGIGVVSASQPAGAVAPPALTITPGPYHNEQLINLSVGPNHFFTPYSRINIIECADPGGKAKNLPNSVDGCDGNTIQGVTILVQRDGSWFEHGYQLYALPNASQLGESADSQPVCNQKKSCVLYIGQNQEKFTAPKMFSAAFVILKSGKYS